MPEITKQTTTDIKENNKESDDIFNIICRALHKAHLITKATIAAKDINDTIKNYNREKAIYLIAININKYKSTINFLSNFTGRYIIYRSNYYDDKTDEYILNDLEYLKIVIYVSEAITAGLEQVLQKQIQKLGSI